MRSCRVCNVDRNRVTEARQVRELPELCYLFKDRMSFESKVLTSICSKIFVIRNQN